jgi:DNA-3-methyladenine glycosylase I
MPTRTKSKPSHAAQPLFEGLFKDDTQTCRCAWCQATPTYRNHHDSEWGVPVDDERRLFEKISVEGFQAGLSWLTILNKRENFRAAFANFDYEQVAAFDEADVKRQLPAA